jgi:cytochrome c
MKKILFLSLFAFCFCKKTEEQTIEIQSQEPDVTTLKGAALGKELFEGRGMCTTCHKTDVKIIGPSTQEIAKIYKEKKASVAAFINEESEPIIDPSQYEVMKANFQITKKMTDEERKAIEAYIMEFGK